MDHESTEGLEELWSELLEGELSPADRTVLNAQLDADPGLAMKSAEAYRLHRLLCFHFSDDEKAGRDFTTATMKRIPENPEPFVAEFRQRTGAHRKPPTVVRIWPRVIGYAAAALVLVAVTLGFKGIFGTPDDGMVALETNEVATVLFAENCQWVEGGGELAEGSRIGVRDLELDKGMAVIRFDGGAEMIMKAGSKIGLLGAGKGKVFFGQVLVRAEDGAEGFTLDTPTGKVVDLGTEFAVKVEPSGASEVHVLDGMVAVGEGKQADVIKAGRAVRFEEREGKAKEVAVDSKRFAESLHDAKPRRRGDLMWIYEGFNYSVGEQSMSSTKGGKGWSSPWRLRSPEENSEDAGRAEKESMRIVRDELNISWPVEGGREGMLELGKGSRFLVRDIAEPIPMDRDGVFYFSMMLRETTEPGAETNRHGAFRLTFRDSKDYFGDSLSFGFSPERRPHIFTGPGVGFVSATLAPERQSILFVGKVVTRKTANDEISFRMYGEDEELGYAEPAAWHVTSKGVSQSVRFDRLLLTSKGRAPRVVDEIRIGPTWRSVVPFKESEK